MSTKLTFDPRSQFKCTQCGTAFAVDPGPSGSNVRCPRDGNLYAEWVDWQRFYAQAVRQRGKVL